MTKDEKFLRDYILNRKWIDNEDEGYQRELKNFEDIDEEDS